MTPPDSSRPKFEASLEELEAIVRELEGGDLPLDRSLDLFARGSALSEACRKQLEEAESRVEMLTRKDGSWQPEDLAPER